MATYLISYDIAEKDAFEYEGLWNLLNSMGAERVLYSEWVLSVENSSPETIYNKILTKIQRKDSLLVTEILSSCQWNNLKISDDAFAAVFDK